MSERLEDTKSSGETDENAEESRVVTLLDVLEQQKQLEEESAAVLGGSDEKCCTYQNGYIKRQALYSCLTCSPDSAGDLAKSAGICLACSYHCHEGHELVELYTKRNFRCDCSTEKIVGKKCSFVSLAEDGKKNAINSENLYNQNFAGLYCTCKRPYPDPDDPVQDDMIQCIICEDWFHTRHLETSPPKADMYSEMVCGACMQSFPFLKDYTGIAVNKIDDTSESFNVSVTEDDDKLKSELDKSISDIMNISSSSSVPSETEEGSPATKKIKLEGSTEACKKPAMGNSYNRGAVFWPDNWRKNLCCCPSCRKMYEDLKVSFLLDPEDSVQFYEENGLKKVEGDYEREVRVLSTMNRVQQIDVITEYNRMKDKLIEFLHPFVASKKVVTEEDINNFFQGMKNEKNTNLGMPHFCR